MRLQRRCILNTINWKYSILSILVLITAVCIGLIAGSSDITIPDLLTILGHKLFSFPIGDVSSSDVSIIWILRLPRIMLALLVGGSLALSGSCIQSVLKNPLASPFTLGVSSGASFGAALIIISGFSLPFLDKMTLPIAGLLSALLTILIVIHFTSKIDKYLSNQTIILAGIVFSLFINSLLTILTAVSHEEMKHIILWQMGSLSLRGWPYVHALIPFFLAGVIGTIIHTKELDALSFGEENALSLGVDVKRVKRRLIFFSAILAGSAVAVTGTIGFIGLVTPHIVRRVFGPRHIYVLPFSIIFGGIFLIAADLLARTLISPSELPVGAITAFIGAPFFGFIYFTRRK